MRRWIVGSAIGYVALSAFSVFGAQPLSVSTQQALRPYVWLLGPPANLVHGSNFLWPFVIGTVVVAGLIVGLTRSKSRGAQFAYGVALLIGWAVFGFIAYAPGA